MRYLSNYKLFENTSFPTDPKVIRKLCKEYGIKDYTINQDKSIDVAQDVNLSNLKLKKLPLKFGHVYGSFD